MLKFPNGLAGFACPNMLFDGAAGSAGFGVLLAPKLRDGVDAAGLGWPNILEAGAVSCWVCTGFPKWLEAAGAGEPGACAGWPKLNPAGFSAAGVAEAWFVLPKLNGAGLSAAGVWLGCPKLYPAGLSAAGVADPCDGPKLNGFAAAGFGEPGAVEVCPKFNGGAAAGFSAAVVEAPNWNDAGDASLVVG